MATIEINIDNYLSESEKKEIAIDVFREHIEKELFKTNKGTVQSDSEIQRIVGNISHEIVMQEVQKHIPGCENMIKNRVIAILNEKDFSYQIFKKADAWEKPESLAITYMNDTIRDNRELFQSRIKEYLDNYDLSKDVSEEISEFFDKLGGNMYALSELFHNKSK